MYTSTIGIHETHFLLLVNQKSQRLDRILGFHELIILERTLGIHKIIIL